MTIKGIIFGDMNFTDKKLLEGVHKRVHFNLEHNKTYIIESYKEYNKDSRIKDFIKNPYIASSGVKTTDSDNSDDDWDEGPGWTKEDLKNFSNLITYK